MLERSYVAKMAFSDLLFNVTRFEARSWSDEFDVHLMTWDIGKTMNRPIGCGEVNMPIHTRIVYSKNDLYSLRRMVKKIRSKPDYDLIDRLRLLHILHYRGSRGGSRRQRPIEVMTRTMSYSNKHRINSNNNKSQLKLRHLIRPPIVADEAVGTVNQAKHQEVIPESLYIINARSLAKSHAIEQLHANLIGCNIEVT